MDCALGKLSLSIIYSATSGLSAIACALVILTCILGKVLDSLTMRLVLCMSFSDITRSAALILSLFIDNTIVCKASALIIVFSVTLNVFCASCITILLYKIIVQRKEDLDRFTTIWLIFSHALSIIIGILPLITDSYGFNGDFCTLRNDYTGNLWRFTIVYIPYWIFILLIVFVMPKLYRHSKSKNSHPVYDIIFNRGFIYSLILAVLVITSTIFRIWLAVNDGCASAYISLIDEIVLALHGFFNSLAFFINHNIFSAIFNRFSGEERAISIEKYFKVRSTDGSIQ